MLIVAYRSPQATSAVASLLAGSLRPAWVGVRDHSPAGAPPPLLPAEVDYQRDPSNPGFAVGVNRLAGRAPPGRDLLLFNPDATAGAATLATLAAFMATHPTVGAATVVIEHDPPAARPWFAGARVRPWLADVRHLGELRPDGATDFVTGAAMWIRRAAWEQVGPLEESLFLYAEDLDWSLRARRAGWQLAVAPSPPEARVHHLVSASVGADGRGLQRRTYYVARNTLRVLRRHHGSWRVLPLGLPRLAWIGLRTPAHRAWFCGLADGLRGRGGPWSPDRGDPVASPGSSCR